MRRLALLALAMALLPAGAAAQTQWRMTIHVDSLLDVFSVDTAAREPTKDVLEDVGRLRCGGRAGLEDGHCTAELETGLAPVCRAAAILTAYRAITEREGEVTHLRLRCSGNTVDAGLHQASGEREFFRVRVYDRDETLESSYMVPIRLLFIYPERAAPAEREEPRREPQRPRRPTRTRGT